ncbi:MAG: hypothetical protein U1D68_16140 [Arthrobacter sp.]|nr:hypothetical protein [Arthrobacter sp.]MDZ4354355.1 hypothetical protein [Arthrobacter sp.]
MRTFATLVGLSCTALLATGLPLPVRSLTFTPRVAYPYGEQCGRFISAGVLLDADGLRAV